MRACNTPKALQRWPLRVHTHGGRAHFWSSACRCEHQPVLLCVGYLFLSYQIYCCIASHCFHCLPLCLPLRLNRHALVQRANNRQAIGPRDYPSVLIVGMQYATRRLRLCIRVFFHYTSLPFPPLPFPPIPLFSFALPSPVGTKQTTNPSALCAQPLSLLVHASSFNNGVHRPGFLPVR